MTEEATKDANQINDPRTAPAQAMALSPQREAAQIERQRAMAETTFGGSISPFSNGDAFKLACTIAERIANSDFIPAEYKGKPENVMVAMDYASRFPGMTMLSMMQVLDVVKGRPGLRGTFLAGLINRSPLFSRMYYEWRGTDNPGGEPSMDYGCRAYAVEVATGITIYGTWIDWRMVKGEGWYKNDKWNYMRDQMFQYRASSFWTRVNASDITLGMHSTEELEDLAVIEGDYTHVRRESNADKLEKKLADAETMAATVVADAKPAEAKPATTGTRRKVKSKDESAPERVKCDGNHGGAACADTECWQIEAEAQDRREAAGVPEPDTDGDAAGQPALNLDVD